MSPAWRGIPEVPRRLQGLTTLLLLPPLLLLLLQCPHASRGDCKLPPDIPNAQAALKGLTSFPEGDMVTYKCNDGFIKVPGKPDTVVCLQGNEWSQIEEFCNRSCNVPTRLLFASLKNPYNRQNYFPLGSVVEYECRKGFKRNHSLSGNLTCLQNFTWSKPDEFCKKKSCPNPGEIINGHVNIKTDILFGGLITFSCNTGYKLVGVTSSYCLLKGENVDWGDPFPECKEISHTSKVTPTPQKPTTVDVSGTKAPSTPQIPTTVDVPGTKAPSTPQKHTTVIVPATEVASTPQELTTVNFSATEAPLTPQKSTTLNIPAIEFPSSLQKPITANVPATEATSTPQKPTKINSSATKTLLIAQKSTLHVPTNPQKPTSNISVVETPSTPQKPITANDSFTIAKITPVSNALSTETPPAAQTPIMANSSVTQATPKTQRLTTAKASFTQSLPGTQKFTAAHAPVTKRLHTTQRLPSTPISATRSTAVPRATTPFHARSTPRGKGTPSADDSDTSSDSSDTSDSASSSPATCQTTKDVNYTQVVFSATAGRKTKSALDYENIKEATHYVNVGPRSHKHNVLTPVNPAVSEPVEYSVVAS